MTDDRIRKWEIGIRKAEVGKGEDDRLGRWEETRNPNSYHHLPLAFNLYPFAYK